MSPKAEITELLGSLCWCLISLRFLSNLYLIGISLLATSLSSFHCAPLREVWSHLLYSTHLVNRQEHLDPPSPFL